MRLMDKQAKTGSRSLFSSLILKIFSEFMLKLLKGDYKEATSYDSSRPCIHSLLRHFTLHIHEDAVHMKGYMKKNAINPIYKLKVNKVTGCKDFCFITRPRGEVLRVNTIILLCIINA